MKKAAAPILYLLLAALALWQSVSSPMHNWDIIGYIAAAKSYEESDSSELHGFTYQQLRKSVTPKRYKILASGRGNLYRKTIGEDPAAFEEQLPFYQIRPVYTGLIYLLYKAGTNITFATHLVSGIAVSAGVALLFLLARRFLTGFLVYALPPLALVCGVVDLARFSTPDGLAFCSMVLATLFFMTGRVIPLLLLFPIMIGIRTDLMLFALPLLAAQVFINNHYKWKVLLSALACIAVYAFIASTWQSHSWSTTFHFTLVKAITHPASMPPELTAREYFTALAKGTKALLISKVVVLFGMLTAYSIGLLWARAKAGSFRTAIRSPVAGLALGLPIFVVSHFLLFPVVGNRFYSGAALLAAFALLAIITEYIHGASSSVPLHPHPTKRVHPRPTSH